MVMIFFSLKSTAIFQNPEVNSVLGLQNLERKTNSFLMFSPNSFLYDRSIPGSVNINKLEFLE